MSGTSRRQPACPRLGDHFPASAEEASAGSPTGVAPRSFTKLSLNFTCRRTARTRSARNVFEGGFLGLDNIGVFDRSAPCRPAAISKQADGTAWMALFCQNMLEIAVELAMTDPDYGEMALEVRRALPLDRLVDLTLARTWMWDEG